MIEIKNLKKYFNGTKAVDGITFTVQQGEIFGLLGPNGAGKTTTLRMLATVLQPTEGDAVINGCSIRLKPEQVRQQIGVLAEHIGLYDRLTAEENVRYFARLRRLSGRHYHSQDQRALPQARNRQVRPQAGWSAL